MMNKIFILFISIILASNSVTIGAKENNDGDIINEQDNLLEEIDMFDNFYKGEDNYIFQDRDGNTLNSYILEKRDEFYKNRYETTDSIMERVKSVQDINKIITQYINQSKTWTNMKVYYTKSKYCVYSVTATYNVSGGKITSGKATPKVISYTGLRSYNISSSITILSNKKSAVFTLTHKMDAYTVKTKHNVSI